MRHAPRSVFALAILAGCRPSAAPSDAPSASAAPTPVVESRATASVEVLAFLVGTWVADTPEGRVTEAWTKEGDALVGRSETVKDGAQSFYEDLRIATNDGVLVYSARPMGRTPATEFRRTDDGGTANVVVFENPAHDFPKRIRYERNGDRLTASIDADGKGATWEYRRAP